MGMENNKILEKVRKLLSLADSDNENEARLAMEKANEMILRHNLSLKDVNSASDIVERPSGKESTTSCVEDKFLLGILKKFFFVQPLFQSRWTGKFNAAGRRVMAKQILFVGLPQNVEIAAYTYHYLLRSFRKLWLAYKKETGAPAKARQAYYYGLAEGIGDRLSRKKRQVETETGLVWVGDRAIDEYLKDVKVKKRGSRFSGNSDAEMAGQEAGKTLDILQGLKANSEATKNGKLIG